MIWDVDCQSYKAPNNSRHEATSSGPEQCLLANVWGQGHEIVLALKVFGMDVSVEEDIKDMTRETPRPWRQRELWLDFIRQVYTVFWFRDSHNGAGVTQ